jgi:hypothetical protein
VNEDPKLAVVQTLLPLLEALGSSATFLLRGLPAIASWIFSFARAREADGRTLEHIEESWPTANSPRGSRNDTSSPTKSPNGRCILVLVAVPGIEPGFPD